LLNFGGFRAAALGTLGLLQPGRSNFEQRGLTTPDAGKLQQLMRELVEDGTTHLVMEVSSHALIQHRVDGIEFTGGVFTNLSQDHLDFHASMEEYREAKALLFLEHLQESGGYAVINCDDEAGRSISQRFTGLQARYGTNPTHNLVMRSIQGSVNGVTWELVLKNGVWPESLDLNVNLARLHSPLAAHYNAYNCTAAAGVALLEGMTLDDVSRGIAAFDNVPGRLQRVPNAAGINVYVDYAHTPDALYNVLAALQEIRQPGSRIITVMGCGGDRDAGKRPKMGRAAQQGSELLILTSDNPRSEDPQKIIDMIEAGLEPDGAAVLRQADRRKAIRLAIQEARPGDIVLIAGKGHEDYQIIGTQTTHFSDVEEAETSLAEINGSWSPQGTR
jgi:UDP-N-acetylmuramoyl-L-alanyl-D-glutamate--2,6-diaminopimelate ligase